MQRVKLALPGYGVSYKGACAYFGFSPTEYVSFIFNAKDIIREYLGHHFEKDPNDQFDIE